MTSASGRYTVVLNGEIYNYRELRNELSNYSFHTATDTEVLLAALERWGPACSDKLIGMFAFLVWDAKERRLHAVRDRFGVKPLFYSRQSDGGLLLASEIKALWRAGVPRQPDQQTWANYLVYGSYGYENTFWKNVHSLPAGYSLVWDQTGLSIGPWYDLAKRVTASGEDSRSDGEALEDYRTLLENSLALRFRSDVPVGVCLSGGLDSSVLFAAIEQMDASTRRIPAFTFSTESAEYDELPWVARLLAGSRHQLITATLRPTDVPSLAAEVQSHHDQPFGGVPTLAYSQLFRKAADEGVTVLLDGQGMDEQWAGYDYYRNSAKDQIVQGVAGSPLRPRVLRPEFAALARPPEYPEPFPDQLRNLQLRDLTRTKLPRALRFNDHISMQASVELREPFLDHRLVEMALRQPRERKIRNGVQKWGLRELAAHMDRLGGNAATPKRPVQTPQTEWLRGPLARWGQQAVNGLVETEPERSWFDVVRLKREWDSFCDNGGDNSFFVWQWISAAMLVVESK